jgi:hypothetical protein
MRLRVPSRRRMLTGGGDSGVFYLVMSYLWFYLFSFLLWLGLFFRGGWGLLFFLSFSCTARPCGVSSDLLRFTSLDYSRPIEVRLE